MPASRPTPPGHGTPDRLPVCRLAFALAHLPAIAFQVLLDELHATDHSTASTSTRLQPRLASHPTPRPGHGNARSAAGAPSRRRPGPLAGDCLPGAARRWRRRRFEASFTDREDEDPAELPVIEHRLARDTLTRPRHARSAAGVPSRRRPGPLAGDRLPGAARRWRRRRFVAGFTDREDEDPAELPVIEHRQHGTRHWQPRLASYPDTLTRPRHARSAAGVPSRLRPGPLAGDRHQVPLDTGAVVASWPASPIERTKTRKNCR
jgi:hypothetical protein